MDNKQSDQMQKKLKSTKEAIDKAEDGEKKQSAQKHYQSAQQAQSANRRLSLAFSSSSAFNLAASDTSMPPYLALSL